ncbi:hypothetical protein B0H14DRAFT_3469437 [Mycena olivaceomarginata]|nr:hypothetical protein B0H14DRAFT_3469437 [Mycena olivaceomarginata]
MVLGIYLVLFCICIYILLNRPRPGNTIYLITAIALFTLCTAQAVLMLVLGAGDVDYLDIPYDHIEDAANIIYGVNNIIADALVIYRCYVVWDRKIHVVVLPILMLIVTSVFAVDLKLPASPFFGLSFATNVLVTALTAGRIWWICRQCRLQSNVRTAVQRQCVSSVAIMVESGVLYSATVLAYLILNSIPSMHAVRNPIYQMLVQVVGIAPTLIIVRVGLGVKTLPTESTLKMADVMASDSSRFSQTDLEKGLPGTPRDVEKGFSNYDGDSSV